MIEEKGARFPRPFCSCLVLRVMSVFGQERPLGNKVGYFPQSPFLVRHMLFAISLAGFFVSLTLESITSWIIIKGSKKKHPSLWKHAGRPTLLGNGDLMSAYPLIKYLWRRDYAELNDRAAVSYADRMLLPTVLTYASAVVFAVALFLSLFTIAE